MESSSKLYSIKGVPLYNNISFNNTPIIPIVANIKLEARTPINPKQSRVEIFRYFRLFSKVDIKSENSAGLNSLTLAISILVYISLIVL